MVAVHLQLRRLAMLRRAEAIGPDFTLVPMLAAEWWSTKSMFPGLRWPEFNGVGGEGWLGGIMAGYNHQMNNIVLGLQGEVGYNDLHTELSIPIIPWTT